MKLDFLARRTLDEDDYHQYCVHCHAESVEWTVTGNRKHCRCLACGRVANRAIVLDPAISWWQAPDCEYWHESAGVFVRDSHRRFLFFDRTAFPFAMTIPAGHVERHEETGHAAARELEEETGILASALQLVTRTPIIGDECRRGSDAHFWHVYRMTVEGGTPVQLGSEGRSPVWLTLDDARSHRLTLAVRYLIERHAEKLIND